MMKIKARVGVLSALTAALLATVALPLQAEDEEIPFSVAKVFFQLNDTDGDLGIHGIIDGEPWAFLEIEAPNGRSLLNIRTRSKLMRQGLTELRFESAEPTFDELAPEIFFSRFPEGTYEVEGLTLEGEELESEVEITHVLPAAPSDLRVSGVVLPTDCDEDPIPVIGGELVITWDAVTTSHPELGRSGPVEIVRYEISVEREEPTLKLTSEVGPGVTELRIPAELVESEDEIKFQVLATDAGGNETSSESCFIVL